MARRTILCDVDGVVADLMGGMSTWLQDCGHPALDSERITLFDIRKAAREPALIELDDFLRTSAWPEEGGDGGVNGAFMSFMRGEAYDWVKPIPGAVEGIRDLQETHDVYFVTALMKACPEHVPSKMLWMERYFPNVEYFTAPSKLKQMISGNVQTTMIDDRYDTCQRFWDSGQLALLFRQPWNEAPEGAISHDWTTIPGAIRGRYKAT